MQSNENTSSPGCPVCRSVRGSLREDLADEIYDWTNNPQDRKSLGDYDIPSLTDRLITFLGKTVTEASEPLPALGDTLDESPFDTLVGGIETRHSDLFLALETLTEREDIPWEARLMLVTAASALRMVDARDAQPKDLLASNVVLSGARALADLRGGGVVTQMDFLRSRAVLTSVEDMEA